MAGSTDFLADVPRDKWGRPMILAPDGSGRSEPYTRVSTMAGALDDKSALIDWRGRVITLGMARKPELATMAMGAALNSGDPLHQSKRELQEISDLAFEAGGGKDAAMRGTTLHSLTQAEDAGRVVDFDIGPWRPFLDAYRRGMNAYVAEVIESETFVINDTYKVAGTFDRLLRMKDGRVLVGDLKTGRDDPSFALKVVSQVAFYANAQRYDPTTGARSPIHPELDTRAGVLIHLSQYKTESPTCDFYELDLTYADIIGQATKLTRGLRTALKKAKPYPASN